MLASSNVFDFLATGLLTVLELLSILSFVLKIDFHFRSMQVLLVIILTRLKAFLIAFLCILYMS